MHMLSRIWLCLFFLFSSFAAWAEEDQKKISQDYYRSYQYEKMGDYTDAIQALQRVYKNYPNGFSVNLRLAYLYQLNYHYANARSHYERSLQVVPGSISPRLGLMSLSLLQKDYDKAENIAYQITKIDYYNYYGNLRLAIALRSQEKFDLAQSVVLKMLALYPSDISFLEEYGILRFAAEEYKDSEKVFRDVLTLSPENPVAHTYLDLLDKM